jgi:DNA-binding CsgD family transcriptional regulator
MIDAATPQRRMNRRERPFGLIALILFQCFCTAFFVYDVTRDLDEGMTSLLHMLPEVAATIGLVIGVVFEVRSLLALLRRQARMEKGLGVASGALNDLMEEYFRQWALTPAEQDVATFTIKGCSIADIAQMRGSAEGTVKTHLNAIYRKAGVQGRGQLVSVLIEDLMNAPLVGKGGAAAG